jgi:hypothetical protein
MYPAIWVHRSKHPKLLTDPTGADSTGRTSMEQENGKEKYERYDGNGIPEPD